MGSHKDSWTSAHTLAALLQFCSLSLFLHFVTLTFSPLTLLPPSFSPFSPYLLFSPLFLSQPFLATDLFYISFAVPLSPIVLFLMLLSFCDISLSPPHFPLSLFTVFYYPFLLFSHHFHLSPSSTPSFHRITSDI